MRDTLPGLYTEADLLSLGSYRDFLHPHLPVLCIESTTTYSVARRSNFLFNCICCVASRYCLEKPELARALQRFGRMELSRFPLDKCIEVVQAHLIYAHWVSYARSLAEGVDADLLLIRISCRGTASRQIRHGCVSAWRCALPSTSISIALPSSKTLRSRRSCAHP